MTAADPAAAAPFPVRCAWCERARVDDAWVAEAEAVGELVTHGICDECLDWLRERGFSR